jgi:hypothetical protein
LAKILAKKNKVDDEENFEMIRQFILAAIQEDFYCDGAESVEIEKHFVIEGDGFAINGFIDKASVGADSVKIIDYKTSKKKFTKEELNFNLQNYFYTYAAQQLWPGKKISFDFQFLKFPPKTVVHAPEIGKEEMEGFLVWLKEMANYIDTMTFDKAKDNVPKGKGPGRDWYCGKRDLFAKKADGTDAWECSFRKPFIYFALFRDNKTVKTSRDKSELEKELIEGDRIVQCSHPGCFAWRKELENIG